MSDALEIWEKPVSKEIFMLAGWRQWADAGSVSSGLPEYLAGLTHARPIGKVHAGGFYLFQIPGTHHLLRPIVKFEDGHPKSLETMHNDLYYAGDEDRGLVFFLGDEPHLDVEGYTSTFLEAASSLGVKRIVGFGGVYGEVPYDRERMVSSTYSLTHMKEELQALAVSLSDYEGGASIGSYICRRAGEAGIEYASFYAFVPLYDFSHHNQLGSSIRIDNDFMAWLGVSQRVSYMLKLGLDLSDLEEKSHRLIATLDAEVNELAKSSPQLDVQGYFERLRAEFSAAPFVPPDDFWEEKLRGLFDD